MNENRYFKYDNSLKPGRTLYDKYRDTVTVVELQKDVFTVKNHSNVITPQHYFDVGQVLFFSEDDYKNMSSPDVIKKYEPYKGNVDLAIVEKRITKSNSDFFSNMSYHDKEMYVEDRHLKKVQAEVQGNIPGEIGIINNGNSESFDPDFARRRKELETKRDYWLKVYNSPYFAELAETGKKPVYIGEKAVPGMSI